jgi:hypothetical protein
MPNHGPGTYVIKLIDPDKPALFDQNGNPLNDSPFETCGGVFHFTISEEAQQDLLAFSPIPITWHAQEELTPPPSGNITSLEGDTLKLTVSPPEAEHIYHFGLHFNLGRIELRLWSADGLRPLDPTIIEKPPIMGS